MKKLILETVKQQPTQRKKNMNCKLPQVTISGLALSDLFFNHEKSNYDSVNRMNKRPQNEISRDEVAALHQDADDFAKLIGGDVTEEMLVADFLARV